MNHAVPAGGATTASFYRRQLVLLAVAGTVVLVASPDAVQEAC